ncbi:MAG TPA: preprotein translocase subunit YajC [Thermoanaerobaculia bacterium]|nr:preprotein translocase subunit YajC [Thermoanaerobaculia bacterium]HSK81533.1 preprotein translocase subunit YajC [Thermoanaerobaculia bacterium]
MNPINSSSTVLAFQTGGGENLLVSLAPMLIIFGIFYLLLILPMRKRQKAVQQMIQNLKKGDRVLTNGGLYGEISAVDETGGTVMLRIADNVKVKVAKSAIAGLEGQETEKAKGSPNP